MLSRRAVNPSAGAPWKESHFDFKLELERIHRVVGFIFYLFIVLLRHSCLFFGSLSIISRNVEVMGYITYFFHNCRAFMKVCTDLIDRITVM